MTRATLFLSAALLALPSAAFAQSGAPAPAAAAMSSQTQLDRIEGKLDEVLRRLDQARPQPSGAAQGDAGSPGITPPPSSPAPASSAQAYKPGALAIAHAVPKDANGLSEIPPDSVGGFTYTGGPIALTDIKTRGVRYAGPVGVEIQGWLQAKEAGRYQIGTDLTAHYSGIATPPTCFLQAWLEERSLDQRSIPVSQFGSRDASASLVLGAELQPGIYRFRVWIVCTTVQGVTTTSELLIKAPSELNLRPVTDNDLLHREE